MRRCHWEHADKIRRCEEMEKERKRLWAMTRQIKEATSRMFGVITPDRSQCISVLDARSLVKLCKDFVESAELPADIQSAELRRFVVSSGGFGNMECRCREHPIISLARLDFEEFEGVEKPQPYWYAELPYTGLIGVVKCVALAQVEEASKSPEGCILCNRKTEAAEKAFHRLWPQMSAFLRANYIMDAMPGAKAVFGPTLERHAEIGCPECEQNILQEMEIRGLAEKATDEIFAKNPGERREEYGF